VLTNYFFNFSFFNSSEDKISPISFSLREGGNILREFNYFLPQNTNENSNISREFDRIFSPEIPTKKRLFSRSFIFFSLEEYKRKERNYREVSLRFLCDNSNKSAALAGIVFKEVSIPNGLMRDIILLKTPFEYPPLRRAGLVEAEFYFMHLDFSQKIEKMRFSEIFYIFLSLMSEKLNISFVNNVKINLFMLTDELINSILTEDVQGCLACTETSCIHDKNIIHVSLGRDERSGLVGTMEREGSRLFIKEYYPDISSGCSISYRFEKKEPHLPKKR